MKKHGHNRFGWLFNGDPTASTQPFSRDGGAETIVSRDEYLSAGRDDGTNARSATSPSLASLLDTSAPDSLAESSVFGASAFSAALSPALAAVPINRNPVANSDSYSTRPNQPLTVVAPGLLGNDKDPDGDSLSVSVLNVTGLSGKGVISSGADGSFIFTPNAGFAGDATFTYTISDGFGGSDTASAVIHVTNAAPDAIADEFFVHAGRVLSVAAPGLLANDRDSDGDSLSVSVLNVTGLSGKGVINPRADGGFTFTPNAGFIGDATFTYSISDGFGGSDTANAVIHVTNAAPVASDDHFSTRGNRALTLSAPGLLVNDRDADGDALRVSATNTAGLQGSLSSAPDGGFTFTPRLGFVGTTKFSYTVSDGNGGTATAVASIDVVNQAPDANADEYFVHAGGVLTVAAPGLLANDTDSDGDSLSVSSLNVTGLSGKGVVSPRADGSFTFTPNTGFVGDATFTYTINDGFGGNATATALVHVGNAAPVAVEDSYSVHVGRTLAVAAPGLLANDSDANGDPLQVTSLNVTGLQGTLSPFADGHFSFTPTAGFTGTTSFNYTISDGFGGTSTATVKIDVFNNPPIVTNDTYNMRPNQVLSVAAPGLLANDSDPDGDTLSVVTLDVSGLRGSITPFADGHFSFTPTVGFAGTTSFKYTVSDGAGGTATGTTTINVVNAAPVAVNDSYAMHTNKTLSIAAPGLLANDRDADGDPLQVTSLNVTGLQGTLSPFADGHFSFTPTAGFTGTTSFNYTISDGFGGTSTATVKIDVFNNKPVVNNDTYNIRPNEVLSVAAPGLLANDSDPDGDTLSVVALDVSGLRGSITPFADGHFSFTPTTDFAGTTSFRYTVSDGAGGTATGTATINLVNSSPVAVNDRYAVYAGRTLEVAAPGLLGNDSDADGDALTAKLADVTGLQGSISLLADGHFIFTPKAGFTGRTSFSYTTSDGFGGTATATAAIDVVPIPTKTVSIGNAPDRQSGLGGQWAAAWTNADIVTSIVHKADYTNATETWSAVRLNGVSPQTLAGGDIYAGDLGVSGQSEASSPVRQEIDGKEALRFNLAESATGLTVYLSRLFTQDDGGDFVESGRLRLLDADGHVVKETSFHAGGAAGTQAITLTSDLAFSAIELSAGVYDGSTFVPGGYAHADGSFAATVTSDAVGVKHGSDFLVDKIDFQVPVLGVPLTDVFAP